MIEFKVGVHDYVRWGNVYCKSILSACQVAVEGGVPDQAWIMTKDDVQVMEGRSVYNMAYISTPSHLMLEYRSDDPFYPD